MRQYYVKYVLWTLFVWLAAAGCNAPKAELERFNQKFEAGWLHGGAVVEESLSYAASKVKQRDKPAGEDLLWSLQAGSLERMGGDYAASNKYFDASEEILNYFDHQNELADSAFAVVSSDNMVPYLGEEYDGTMVNTYKALNFIALGKDELARVEFNRALDRQRRAKETFAREIAKVREEIKSEGRQEVKRSVENPKVQQIIEQKYPGLRAFEAYPDFVNPFTTYIAGVYFGLVGDYSKAAPLLKEAYGMAGENKYIREDLAAFEAAADGVCELKDTVWVIFENGMGPVKDEFRVDLPVFLATSKVKYVGIALPRLRMREGAYRYLVVEAGRNSYKTEVAGSIDRVVQTEFKKDFEGILARAIVSAAAKAAAQYALEEEGSEFSQLASIGMGIYSLASTAADVRIWTMLPKEFQVARFSMPADRRVRIMPCGGEAFEIEISPCTNALIYVRIPFSGGEAVYDVMGY